MFKFSELFVIVYEADKATSWDNKVYVTKENAEKELERLWEIYPNLSGRYLVITLEEYDQNRYNYGYDSGYDVGVDKGLDY